MKNDFLFHFLQYMDPLYVFLVIVGTLLSGIFFFAFIGAILWKYLIQDRLLKKTLKHYGDDD